jgi:hypothetical protein
MPIKVEPQKCAGMELGTRLLAKGFDVVGERMQQRLPLIQRLVQHIE